MVFSMGPFKASWFFCIWPSDMIYQDPWFTNNPSISPVELEWIISSSDALIGDVSSVSNRWITLFWHA